jgi:Tannase and feruloyl esterase/3HB-oligomer hydrolase (3HBOH)
MRIGTKARKMGISRSMRRAVCLVVALLALAAAPAGAATCPRQDAVRVPGAERQVADCLDDLTTKGTATNGHTDQSDWATLHSRASRNPATVVPGLQVDGYFPDTSTSNAYRGWMHDAQFVIRLPNEWNGKLVVTGAPGIRRQFAADYVIGDFALARGYAYASTDKGNSGTTFYRDGARPGDALAEWHRRVTELTRAAKEAVRSRYGRGPERIYMTGISNGGYLTRWQLENHPELYDGGVDWEGTLMLADGPNPFTYLPVALRSYAAWKRGDEGAHQAILAAGFAPGSEQQWDDHYAEYWDLTQRLYREEFDPGYDGALEGGTAFCQPGAPFCDADYDYASRPAAVHDAVGRVSLTGRIGKPLLTLHGTLDALLPIRTDSDVYTRMIRAAGRGALHRYYVIEGGSHVDARYDRYPDALRPILPCYRSAFAAFEAWVEHGAAPPPSQTVARTAGGDVANACPLRPAAAARRAKPKLRLRVTPRRARAGHRTRFRFRVTSRGKPVRGAHVRFLGRTKRTGRHGRARMTRRPMRRGVRRATATKHGYRAANTRVRVRNPQPS